MTTAIVQSKAELASESQSWASRARGLQIVDAESCKNASLLLRSVKTLRGQVQQFWEPHIESAMESKRKAEATRKGLADERDRMEAPLIEAETLLKRNLLAFETAQEHARLEEERRLQAEAQARAEAITRAAGQAMAAEALAIGDSVMLEEAKDILAQPVEAPVVSVATSMPKVQGVFYRDQWKAHPDIDIKALSGAVAAGAAPRSFLEPNVTAINQFARATKGTQDVPGVRFFNDRQVAARG